LFLTLECLRVLIPNRLDVATAETPELGRKPIDAILDRADVVAGCGGPMCGAACRGQLAVPVVFAIELPDRKEIHTLGVPKPLPPERCASEPESRSPRC